MGKEISLYCSWRIKWFCEGRIMKDCEKCLHSRLIVSENGYHSVCCLSQKKAVDCMTGKKSQFTTLEKDKNDNIKESFKR